MRRFLSIVFVLLMASIVAFADTIDRVLPVSSVWGASSKAYISDCGYDLKSKKTGNTDLLIRSNVEIEKYPMDAYYVFSANQKTHMGLAKITYLLKDANKLSKEEILNCKQSLIDSMKHHLGQPKSEKDSVTKWELNDSSIEIGTGKFEKYNGSSQYTVAIVVKGTNISKAAGQIIDSHNAKVPKDQEAMRKYMFDPPYRQDKEDSFVSGLYTIDGLTYQSGSKGNEVSEIQRLLINIGYLNSGEADGSYGKKTASAIMSFQSQNGLRSSGTADLATQFKLVMSSASLTRKDSCYIAQSGNYAVVVWPLKAFYIGTVNGKGWFDAGTYYYVSGEYYAGGYKSNLRSGQGTAYFANGDVYVGQWDNDKMNGTGTYYFGGKTSSTYYEGGMSNNMMNGRGTYWYKGIAITGSFSNNKHKSW